MDYAKQANELVEKYFLPQGITNPKVLKAFKNTPRHKFVPKEYKQQAYLDIALPIGEEQTISQPSLVALMTQSLNLKGNEKVLEIGTGSGYQTAILSQLAREVYTVEIIPSLAKKAKKVFKWLGYINIHVFIANGSIGLPKEAPYDAIIVTAGAKKMPEDLISQLKEGGRIVIPIGIIQFSQKLILGVKKDSTLITQELESVAFVPLVGKYIEKTMSKVDPSIISRINLKS